MDYLSSKSRDPNEWRGVLVGREREQTLLRSYLTDVFAGEGRLVLIGGEAGIGKTTLVSALSADAHEQGALILTGHCYDLMTTPPYGPWMEIITTYRPPDDLPVPSPAMQDEDDQRAIHSQDQLFTQFFEFFTAISEDRPLILVLEDLHWSDPASLEFLRFLARRATRLRILILVTYRTDELTRQHVLYQHIPHLIHGGQARRINLHQLDAAATREVIRSRYDLSSSATTRLVNYLHDLAEGNPFFINELLQTLEEERLLHLTEQGWTLEALEDARVPPLVHQVIDGRLFRLNEDTQRLLEVAAVIGQDIPVELWRTVSAAPMEALISAVRQAVAAHVIEEDVSSRQLRFCHALVRQALYERVVLPERTMLHRRVAEALALEPMPNLDAVAFHFAEAGDARAVDWLIRAGMRAYEIYAPEVAISHLTRAIELSDQFLDDVPSDVYRVRGLAHATHGNFDRARSDFETALQRARAASDRQVEWQTLLDLGMLWAERDYIRTGEYFQLALELARTMGDSMSLAHSLNRLGNWYVNVDQPLDGKQYHQEALTSFQEIGDRRGIAATLDLVGMASFQSGDATQAASYYRQAIDHFRELDDRQGLSSSLANLSICGGSLPILAELPATLDTVEAMELGELAVRTAHEIGWRAGEAYALTVLGLCLSARGDYRRAFDAAHRGLKLAENIEHRQWMCHGHWVLGLCHLDLGQLRAAQTHLEQAVALARGIGSMIHTHLSTASLALLYLQQEEFGRAESLLDAMPDLAMPATSNGQRLCWSARAELALARERPGLALSIVDQLGESAHDEWSARAIPQLAKLRGEALCALERFEEAEAELQSARQGADEMGYKPLLWRINVALGRLYRSTGQRDNAQQAFARTRTMIDDLASTITDEVLREQFVQQSTALIPAHEAPSLPSRQADAVSGLTPREMEVLRLVAEGLTDPQIAERLFISPRTVHGHLRSIYNKLDVSSRAAATRFAVEHDLI